jgi:hypothetical protein
MLQRCERLKDPYKGTKILLVTARNGAGGNSPAINSNPAMTYVSFWLRELAGTVLANIFYARAARPMYKRL